MMIYGSENNDMDVVKQTSKNVSKLLKALEDLMYEYEIEVRSRGKDNLAPICGAESDCIRCLDAIESALLYVF